MAFPDIGDILGLEWRDNWHRDTVYYTNDAVRDTDGQIYVAIGDNVGTPTSDDNTWDLLKNHKLFADILGPPKGSLLWKGKFNSKAIYHPGDLISEGNTLYTCIANPVAVSESMEDTFIRPDQAEWGDCSDGLHTWLTYAAPVGINTISDHKGLASIDPGNNAELMLVANLGEDYTNYTHTFTVTDQELLVRWEVTESVDGNDGPNLILNWAGANSGVQFIIQLNGNIIIQGNVFTNDPNTLLGTWAGGVANQKYWSRCRYESDVASVVTWEDGTTEPGSWDYSEQVQDSGGYVLPVQVSIQDYGYNNTTTVAFDSFSAHTVSPYSAPSLDPEHWEHVSG